MWNVLNQERYRESRDFEILQERREISQDQGSLQGKQKDCSRNNLHRAGGADQDSDGFQVFRKSRKQGRLRLVGGKLQFEESKECVAPGKPSPCQTWLQEQQMENDDLQVYCGGCATFRGGNMGIIQRNGEKAAKLSSTMCSVNYRAFYHKEPGWIMDMSVE